MEKYYKKNKESANVEIIAVNMTNTERRGLKGVEEFIDDYGLTFPIPLDKDGKVKKCMKLYQFLRHLCSEPMEKSSIKLLVRWMKK